MSMRRTQVALWQRMKTGRLRKEARCALIYLGVSRPFDSKPKENLPGARSMAYGSAPNGRKYPPPKTRLDTIRTQATIASTCQNAPASEGIACSSCKQIASRN